MCSPFTALILSDYFGDQPFLIQYCLRYLVSWLEKNNYLGRSIYIDDHSNQGYICRDIPQ